MSYLLLKNIFVVNVIKHINDFKLKKIMKTKKFEKLESFQLKNEKLETILGGQGAPVKSFYSFDAQATEGGERCLGLGPNGQYQCVSYSSDTRMGDGSVFFQGEVHIEKSC